MSKDVPKSDVDRIIERREKREKVKNWIRGEGPRKHGNGASQELSYLGAGLTFGCTIAVFVFGGLWLDGKLGTKPLFILIGAALGLLGGFVHLVETVSPGTLFPARKELLAKKRKDDAEREAREREDRGK